MATGPRLSQRKRTATTHFDEVVKPSPKRPRLEVAGTSSPSTPKALSAIQSALSNVFRLSTRGSSTKHGASPIDKAYEVPESEEELEETPKPAKRSEVTQTPRSKHSASGRKTVNFAGFDSGDGLGKASSPSRPSPGKPREHGHAAHKSPKRVSSLLAGRSTRREELGSPNSDTQAEDTPVKNGQSSTVRRGKSTVVGERLDDSTADDTTPGKSAGRRGGLESRQIDGRKKPKQVEVFFEDLPIKKARRAQETSAQDVARSPTASSGDDDEEVCTVCSKPDSKAPNEIIFCDGCDMAVHQKCYGVSSIPDGDWFCRDCARDNGHPKLGSAASPRTASVQVSQKQRPDIPDFEQHLRRMQRVLLARCTGRRRIKLRGQEDAYEKVFQLVEQTVLAGEGNSMLVIGARGAGKTTLVEGVVSALSKENRDAFHVVRLNGFIHTDDKLALREIWRQLGREMEVEDELVNKTNNYADTLQSLLAVLSHPSELGKNEDGVASRSVIFIIDEFDLFATHARQTLLYNLFDVAQARKAPIAVLGLTTRIDVVETLEKRVKSRFSHRHVHLALAKSLPAFWDICRQGLTIDEEDLAVEGIDIKLKGSRQFWKYWHERIDALYEDQRFKDHLEYFFYSTKSVPAFFVSCLLPLAALTPSSPVLDFAPPPDWRSAAPPDSKLHLLDSLADLELALLIAAARLDIVAHTDTVNFAMAYDEYTTLMGRQRLQTASTGMLALGGGSKVWGRGVSGMAWERLVALGLLIPAAVAGRGGGSGGHGGLETRMWKVDVALEEIPGSAKLSAVLAKWCKEI